MADLTSGQITSPINRGLLQSETIAQSAVARLAGLRTLGKSETSIYHFLGETDGAYVAEGAVKPETGLDLQSLQVPAVKFIKLFSYTEEALDADPELIKDLIDVQTKSLAKTFDKAVLGLVSTGSADFTNFATGTQTFELASASGFWQMLSLAGNGDNNSILLTATMLNALQGEYNELGQPKHTIVRESATHGTVNGVEYAVVQGVDKSEGVFGIVGPWKTRTVAALGNAEVSTNDKAEKYWLTNSIGALAEIYGGFKAINKSDFVRFTVASSPTPDPEPSKTYEDVMDAVNYGTQLNVEFLYEDGELRVHGGNPGDSLELTGDYTDNDANNYMVDGNVTNFDGTGVATFFISPAPSGVQSWNVSGVYTENTGGSNDYFGNIAVDNTDDPMYPLSGQVVWMETGELTVDLGDSSLNGTLELSGAFSIDGAHGNEEIATYVSPNPSTVENGVAVFTAPTIGPGAGVTQFDVTGVFTSN